MGLFGIINPIKAFFGAKGIEWQQTAHRARFADRDLRDEAVKIFNEHGKEMKENKRLHKSILQGLVKAIEKEEITEINISEHIREHFNHAVGDLIMIAHWQIEFLKHILKEDIKILQQGFPQVEGKKLETAVMSEIQRYEQSLKKARDVMAGAG